MKITICGLNGSGKTTLGKKLAEIIQYKHIDIEDYYFSDNNDYKYGKSFTKEQVVKNLEIDFNKYDNIIFTACKGEFGELSNRYDFAIFIRADKETRLKRVKDRSYKQFGDRILKNGEIIEWFQKLNCNKIEIDGLKPIEENVKIILSKLNIETQKN